LGYMLWQHPNGVDYGDCRIWLLWTNWKCNPTKSL
jgi:hypothetical protein